MTERPEIGARMMRPYGRKEYVDYGEVGTVTAHGDGKRFTLSLDNYQPFAKLMFGSRSKLEGHARVVKDLGLSEVSPLVEIYRGNAERFRRLAEKWDRNAEHEAALGLTAGQKGEKDGN